MDILKIIEDEKTRQYSNINLIASENLVSENILKALGSCLTNKYAEGYPGARYYGGCENVDKIEAEAIRLACELFNAEHANVQPHSGTNANMAVYKALLNDGDTILSMNLDCGGHLSHGAKVSFSGKQYNVVNYGVNKQGYIDYDEVKKLAIQHKPKLIVAGASAYSRIIDFKQFREIADSIGALFMVDMAHFAGLVAAKLYPNPSDYAHVVTSTTHKTLRGPRGGLILCKERYAKAIDKAIFPGIQGGPIENIIAAKAICFQEAMSDEFVEYQKRVIKNSKLLASTLLSRGFDIVSGGTDTHLFLVDLSNKNITGAEAEARLSDVGIIVNKNKIPYDKRNALETSGIRIGTAFITNGEITGESIIRLGNMIADILNK